MPDPKIEIEPEGIIITITGETHGKKTIIVKPEAVDSCKGEGAFDLMNDHKRRQFASGNIGRIIRIAARKNDPHGHSGDLELVRIIESLPNQSTIEEGDIEEGDIEKGEL